MYSIKGKSRILLTLVNNKDNCEIPFIFIFFGLIKDKLLDLFIRDSFVGAIAF